MEETSYREAATTSFDLELRMMTSFRQQQSRASNNNELQEAVMTSFKHDGEAVGWGLVLGFTGDTISFLLEMGLA